MGVQSATARHLGVAAVSTPYVTGMLARLTSGTVEWLRNLTTEQRTAQLDSAGVHGPVLPAVTRGMYAVGVLVGAIIVKTAPTVALFPAPIGVAILALIDYRAG